MHHFYYVKLILLSQIIYIQMLSYSLTKPIFFFIIVIIILLIIMCFYFITLELDFMISKVVVNAFATFNFLLNLLSFVEVYFLQVKITKGASFLALIAIV